MQNNTSSKTNHYNKVENVSRETDFYNIIMSLKMFHMKQIVLIKKN